MDRQRITIVAPKWRKTRDWLLPVVFFFLCGNLHAAEGDTDERTEPVVIEIERLSPDAGRGLDTALIAPSIVVVDFFFHAGGFDYFDLGTPAPDDFREALIAGGNASRSLVSGSTPYRRIIGYPRFNPQFSSTQYPISKVYLNPSEHRYVSFGAKLFPSDDAFAGNDNPRQYPLFDENGDFLGPLVIEIYGRDVLDGGVRINDEAGIPDWDIETEVGQPTPPYEGPRETKPVRPHPGYNGSRSNPNGKPVVFLNELETDKADFTREPYPLTRIRITSGLDASFSGNWYNPDHDGEGFVFDITTNAQGDKLLVVDWFTYQPDTSGEQLWLQGAGKMRDGLGIPDEFELEVDLLEPVGGQFASTDNPETVERKKWGALRLDFVDCDTAEVFLNPLDAAFDREPYLIERLTPYPAGTEHWCNDNRDFSWIRFRRWVGIDPPP